MVRGRGSAGVVVAGLLLSVATLLILSGRNGYISGGQTAGGAYAPPPSSRPAQVSMDASKWQFQDSANASGPNQNGSSWSFNFPVDVDGVHYLVTVPPVLTGKASVTMSGSISAAAGVKFIPTTTPGQPPDTSSATCGFYFQEVGDNLSGAVGNGQNYAYYRWFSHSNRVVLENGNFNVTVGLTNISDWSSVFGEYANARTSTEAGSLVTPGQGFAQALANPAYIGITCGGRFFGHGVYATGQATFMMNSFSVQ